MGATGIIKTIFLGLAAAGLISQAAARVYSGRATLPRPLPAPAAAVPGPERVALEPMERLNGLLEQTSAQVTFHVRGLDPDTGAVFPVNGDALPEIAVWQLQILDRDGRKVHFMQGSGRPASPALGWDGLTAAGEPAPGGFYSARLVWRDRAGGVHSTGKAGFSLFSQLQSQKFSKLKLDLGFLKNFEIL